MVGRLTAKLEIAQRSQSGGASGQSTSAAGAPAHPPRPSTAAATSTPRPAPPDPTVTALQEQVRTVLSGQCTLEPVSPRVGRSQLPALIAAHLHLPSQIAFLKRELLVKDDQIYALRDRVEALTESGAWCGFAPPQHMSLIMGLCVDLAFSPSPTPTVRPARAARSAGGTGGPSAGPPAPTADAFAEFQEALQEEMDTMRSKYEARIRALQDELDRAGLSGRLHEDVMALPTPRR